MENDTDNLKVIIRCSDCGETFPEHQFLIEHMKYVHKKIYYSKCLTKDEYLKKNDIKDSEKQSKITAVENNAENLKVIDFRCTICPAFVKTFQSENTLEDHMKTYHRLDNMVNIEPMSENFDIRIDKNEDSLEPDMSYENLIAEMEKSINQTEIVSPKTKSQTEESVLNFSRSNDQIEDVVIKVEPMTSFEKCQVSESRNESKDAAINFCEKNGIFQAARPKNQSEGGVVINFSGLEPKKSVQIKCQITSGKKAPSLIKCQVPPGKKAPSLIKCQVPPSKKLKIKEEPQ